ncbi:MAG: Cof-type HAD-IIB family hydrolase [Erysipelotrichaceae bacterium]|jgi:Cof subfamily protein (haloacid dehalogenase superfamily)|nr:Cof-type HAD-IIB family hydrolase [Erysipelotrichaceae bacterium]
MIKLFASDIDNTLENDSFPLSERVKKAMVEMQKKGVTLVLATGRILKSVLPMIEAFEMERFHGYAICHGGSLVYDCSSKEIIESLDIKPEGLAELYAYAKEHQLGYCCDQRDAVICTEYGPGPAYDFEVVGMDVILSRLHFMSYIKEPVFKSGFTASKEVLDEKTADAIARFSKDYTIYRATPTNIDITVAKASKGQALANLVKRLGLKKEEILALGDGDNDIGMIELAGIGLAIGNGSVAIKKAADRVLDRVEREGVLKAIELALQG